MTDIIKDVAITKTPQDVVATLGWPAGTVITVQNKSAATLRMTQKNELPNPDIDYVILQPNETATTETGDLTLWIWSPSNATVALIRRG